MQSILFNTWPNLDTAVSIEQMLEVGPGGPIRRDPAYVRWVQQSLNRILGLPLAMDGVIGTQTRSAVRAFQKRERLNIDGVVGAATERALTAAGAGPPPAANGLSQHVSRLPSLVAPAALGQGSGTLKAIARLAGTSTKPTVERALRLVKLISAYHDIPWRVCYTTLQHEGGIRKFRHADGVMQTTKGVRTRVLPRIPRPLALALLQLPPDDQSADVALGARLHVGFPRNLAIQVATGVQEVKENLRIFSGYVALAYQAFNAGAGWAFYTVTQGRGKRRPRGLAEQQWQRMCHAGAALLHQPAANLRVNPGVWQCDANIPAWFSHIPVFDRTSGVQLVAFKYLRSIQECIQGPKPGKASCNQASHRTRIPGSGATDCRNTRPGSLDKLYDPTLLGEAYYQPASDDLPRITDSGKPLRVIGARLVHAVTS